MLEGARLAFFVFMFYFVCTGRYRVPAQDAASLPQGQGPGSCRGKGFGCHPPEGGQQPFLTQALSQQRSAGGRLVMRLHPGCSARVLARQGEQEQGASLPLPRSPKEGSHGRFRRVDHGMAGGGWSMLPLSAGLLVLPMSPDEGAHVENPNNT